MSYSATCVLIHLSARARVFFPWSQPIPNQFPTNSQPLHPPNHPTCTVLPAYRTKLYYLSQVDDTLGPLSFWIPISGVPAEHINLTLTIVADDLLVYRANGMVRKAAQPHNPALP